MRRKLLLATLALPLVVLLALVLYVRFGDHRHTIERLGGHLLDRRLDIAGDFQIAIGARTWLMAEDVTLAGPDWNAETPLVRLDHLEGRVDVWSLLTGPGRLDDVRVAGARVNLEVDAGGRVNWDFGLDRTSRAANDGAIDPSVVLGSLELRDVLFSYDAPGRDAPLEIAIAAMESQTDGSGMIDLELSGRIDTIPVELSGSIGTLANLIAGATVEHRLAGRVGDIEIELQGRVDDLDELRSVEQQLKIEGPDLAELMETLGLPAPLPGPFRVEAYLTADGDRNSLVVEATMRELSGSARGTISTLSNPGNLDLEVSVAGPDLTAIGGLTDVDGLPPGEFDLSGRLVHREGRIRFHDLRARVGDNRLSLDGEYGGLPKFADSDVTIEIEGPDLSVFSKLVGARLPPRPFRLAGQIARKQDGLVVKDLRGRVGRATIEMSGKVGDWPRFAGTHLDMRLSCPDASVFSVLAGFDLPATPIEFRGGLRPGQGRLLLEGVEAELDGNVLSVDGSLARANGFIGSDLRFRYQGSDLASLAYLREFERVPHAPFEATGRFRILDGGYDLQELQLQVGGGSFEARGHVGPIPALIGTDLRIQAGGPDLSRVLVVFDRDGWPAVPYDLRGRLEVLEEGYELEAVELKVGSVRVKVAGRVGALPEALGTELDVELESDDLPALGEHLEIESLPEGHFSAGGHVRREPDGYRLQNFVTRLDAHELRAEGFVGSADRGVGTDLVLKLAGPALAGLTRVLAGDELSDRSGIPDEPYDIKGNLRIVEAGYQLSGVALHAGGSKVRVDGMLGWLPDGHGSDLSVHGEGTDGAIARAIISSFAGVDLPAATIALSGRLQRESHGVQFREVRVRFGDHHVEIDGFLGELPQLIGTRLDVRVAGPGLDLVKRFVDLPMHDAPFSISGHLDGTPQEFALDDLSARLGRSDVSGSMHIDLRGKPKIWARLTSEVIDLPFLRGARILAEGDQPATTPDETASGSPGTGTDSRQVAEEPAGDGAGMWIPDDPLPIDWLRTHDADVQWHMDEFDTLLTVYRNVDLDVSLQDGRLQAGPVQGGDEHGGSTKGRLVLEPEGETFRLTIEMQAENLRYALSEAAENREEKVPHDVLINLTGTGTNLHAIAGSAVGRIIILQGEGRMNNIAIGLLTTDALGKLLSTLNPFSREEPYSRLECGVFVTYVEQGVARLRPLIAVTDKMKIGGRGSIDLSTEKLDLSWVAKPRRGIGLSASAITNSYIKLGGTLSAPSLTVKPLQAATATAAAITTGGLSILAKGFWDRFTSGTGACEKVKKSLMSKEWKK